MKINHLERIERAMDILCPVLNEINLTDSVNPLEVLESLVGSLLSEEEFGEIESYYAAE